MPSKEPIGMPSQAFIKRTTPPKRPYWNGHRFYWIAVACLPFEKFVSWWKFR